MASCWGGFPRVVTASDQVFRSGRPGYLEGVELRAGSVAATATLYDGTSSTDPVITKLNAPAAGIDRHGIGVAWKTGLFVEITGTGATLTLYVP
jgi:hypothetical protein